MPDDHPTVQSGIDSGADTVLVREGTYPERPIVDRPMVLQGVQSGPRPRLKGLQIFNSNFFDVPPLLSVSSIDFSERVEHSTLYSRPRHIRLSFSRCGFDSGFYQLQYLDAEDVDTLSFRDCRLGGMSLARAYQIVMEADTVVGNVSWNNSGALIQRCWFKGGSGTAIDLWFMPRGGAMDNRIENYDIGMYVQDPAGFTLARNSIAGCAVGVVLQSSLEARATENDISNCGTGIDVRGGSDIVITGNRIMNSSTYGILAREMSGLLTGWNVIGNSGSAGIRLVWYEWADESLTKNNTVFNSGRSGFEVLRPPGFGGVRIENNIAFGNREWGLAVSSEELVQLRCNDWFENGLGAISGAPQDSTDLGVDPLFCDLANGDSRLDSSSPLVGDSVCGQVGAQGVGCGATETVVQRFSADRVSEGVRVVWQVAEGATAPEVWLERAQAVESGGWIRPLTERSLENGAVVELDRSAVSDRTYRYRLMALERNEVSVVGQPVLVEAQPRLESRLVDVGPNPASKGPVTIRFALQHAAAIEIDLFDVQGRRVASPARGVWPAGTHAVQWDGMVRDGKAAPAGLYVLRYLHPGGQDKRAIVRVR